MADYGTKTTLPARDKRSAGSTVENDNALAALKSLFARYDLPSSLVDWAWQQLQRGKSQEEITLALYERPEWLARWPWWKQRQEAGLPPLTAEEALQYERSFSEHLARLGMPDFMWQRGKWFTEATSKLILGNVSVDEVIERVDRGLARAKSAPPEVRQAFDELYGAQGDAALASIYLDKDNSVLELEQMYAKADVMGTGRRYGINVRSAELDRLAQEGLTHDQIAAGMEAVNDKGALFDERIGESADYEAGSTGVQAQFGLEPGAKKALERRTEERRASLAGDDGTGVNRRGIGGLGDATS